MVYIAGAGPADAWGNNVPDTKQYYVWMVQNVNGQRVQSYAVNPNYKAPIATSSGSSGGVSAAPVPPHLVFSFDTIGQTIFRSIGHVRLPLRTIWAQGVSESGDETISATQTFAAALCAPIDPDEEGQIFAIFDGGNLVFDGATTITPTGWTPENAALLSSSLAGAVIYPGDEAQLPASLIVADKGADKTNAFRGIRYIIFPNYPIQGGAGAGGSSGLPNLSVGWLRTNDGGSPDTDTLAVEFLSGAD